MRFSSDNSYLFKATPVMAKDENGNETKEVAFYRLTFRDCSISSTNVATTSYFDVTPSAAISKKFGDSFVDMVGSSYKIGGTISRIYNKETQKGYTNFWLDTLE